MIFLASLILGRTSGMNACPPKPGKTVIISNMSMLSKQPPTLLNGTSGFTATDVPLSKVGGCFDNIDMLLMMTVFPGFGGQAFIPDVLPKISEAKKIIDQRKLSVLIEVDGGIKTDNIARVVQAGGEVIVSGSGIFKTPSYADTIRQMRVAVT